MLSCLFLVQFMEGLNFASHLDGFSFPLKFNFWNACFLIKLKNSVPLELEVVYLDMLSAKPKIPLHREVKITEHCKRWHVHSRLSTTTHTQVSLDGSRDMPTCIFFKQCAVTA